MLYTATTLDGPSAVRYPRGQGPGVAPVAEMTALPVGKAQVRRKGRSGLLILAFGALVKSAEIIGERLDATVVNMRFVKPLDEELVMRLAGTHTGAGDDRRERGRRRRRLGGARTARQLRGARCPRSTLGIPDRFIEHGSREDCLAQAELDLGEPRSRRAGAGGNISRSRR